MLKQYILVVLLVVTLYAKINAVYFSGRNSRSSSIAQEPQSLNSSMTSESPKRLSQHRYSTEADKIFKGNLVTNLEFVKLELISAWASLFFDENALTQSKSFMAVIKSVQRSLACFLSFSCIWLTKKAKNEFRGHRSNAKLATYIAIITTTSWSIATTTQAKTKAKTRVRFKVRFKTKINIFIGEKHQDQVLPRYQDTCKLKIQIYSVK